MELQLWRNATLQLDIQDLTILIDPMLGKKGSFGAFPWTSDKRKNPIIDLPFGIDDLKKKLLSIDMVFVSHLHPDHLDETAIKLINKSTAVICPKVISEPISSYGFSNIIELEDKLTLDKTVLHLTEGKHGEGKIQEKMGQVNGLVIQYQDRNIYIAGDTIWCSEVKKNIDIHKPDHIIFAGGAATFSIGEPVTMTATDIKELASYSKNSTIWITHLEAVSPCVEDREFLNVFLKENNLSKQCKILNDGEKVKLFTQ
ncbi:MBL fold metallo-hydrolase [Gracilimonas sp.]|uniref:MBL fold metallo-hydrolase n=1 Tax=Gracilimonas sp. TaxID=1974203 RepID=UPI0032EB88D3